ncbi:hypothetical protein PQR05_37540 [Paraburkholderia sediminicola]|uniref:hypothetical protein n=1 Tax=Paraburkholderia sediminicola TaxID=458836 RepID=UPI0038BE08FA
MDLPTSWTTEPHAAYLDWQANEAAGADRRRFSQRSIIQHKAMFDRFLRHLSQRPTTLAAFGATQQSGGGVRRDCGIAR